MGWRYNEQTLENVHDSCASLMDACRNMRHQQAKGGKDLHAAEAKLVAALEQLRAILQSMSALDANLAHTSGELAGCRPPDAADSATAANTTMLHLPNDVLGRIARLAGKATRAVCSRLRDAYGCAAATIRQPRVGFGVDLATIRYGYIPSAAVLKQDVLLRAVQQYCSSPFTPAAIRSCCLQWPGWAAHVKRLELADTCPLEETVLWHIHTALPALQELTCTPMTCSGGGAPSELPQFLALTQLCLLGSVADLAYHREDALQQQPPARLDLLSSTPNLRSLHLDLRLLHVDGQMLQRVLQSLVQLTHLEVASGPAGPVWTEAWTQGRSMVLLSPLAGRLQSLLLLSSAGWLWQADDVLRSMVCLTRLGCCAGSVTSLTGHACTLLPRLSWLLLLPGTPHVQEDVDTAGWLEDTLRGSMPALQELLLPTFCNDDGVEFPEETGYSWLVLSLLSRVRVNCPQLTSLQVGYHGDWQRCTSLNKPHDAWLKQVAGMQQLQQLVLALDAGCLWDLCCLSRLALLTELWLQLHNADVLQAAIDDQPSLPRPAQGLSELKCLRRLAIRISDCGAVCDGVVREVLSAAALLPQLEVLNASNLAALSASEQPWLSLAASPPACLGEVQRSSVCGSAEAVRLQAAIHSVLASSLARHDAKLVVVPDSGAPGEHHRWGLGIRSLRDLSIRWLHRY